jgi:hypothetical protein
MMKLCLAQTLEGKQCSIMELATVLAEAEQVVNSHPLRGASCQRTRPVEAPSLRCTCSWGKASIEIPEVKLNLCPSLTKRLRYLGEIKREFWKKWMDQVLQGQVLAQKWRKHHLDAQVGDVVLVKNETAAGMEFQRGRVVEAIPGEDGHVRSVQVEYKNKLCAPLRKLQ